jgi:1,4-alpha-glucan branching enzyme
LIYQLGERKYIIAEDLQGYDHINFVAGFHSQWDANFFHTLYHTVKTPNDADRNLTRLSHAILTRYTGFAFSRVIYIESHDTIPENREHRLPMAITPDCLKDPKHHGFYAYRRTMIATTLLFSTPGIPMILQGQEFFETSCPNWPSPPTIDWENRDRFAGVFDTYQKLIKLRTNLEGKTRGLSGSGIRVFHLNEIAKVMAIHRYERGGTGDDVIIIVNFSNKVFPSYKLGLPRPGKWQIRYQVSSEKFDPVYGGKTNESVETSTGTYDGFFWVVSLEISNYDALILSQEPTILLSKKTKKIHKIDKNKK